MTNDAPRSGFGQFVAEIKRRHVVRFSLGYAAAAFVALQLAEIVFPAFGIGEGALRLLVALVTLGFLPAVVLAWLYDLTAHGIRRTQESPAVGPEPRRLSVLAFALIAIGITGGVSWYVLDQDVLRSIATGRAAFDPTEPIRSLAVLPLDDFSQEGDQEYFAAGMHEELIARLSMLEGVRVVSRTSVMRYGGTTMTIPEIGRELGVDVLVEGSVNRSGERVRITLQVIHAPSDSHITTIQFDRDAGDILSLQSEVAHAVVHEIQGAHQESTFTLATADITPAAQEAFFRGKYEYASGTTEGYQAALGYFEEALALDPSFAPAMAGLAGARFLVGIEEAGASGATQLVQARQEAISALEMDSTAIEVLEVLDLIDRSLPGILSVPEVATDTTLPEVTALAMLDTSWVSATTGLGQRIEQRMIRGAPATDEQSAFGRKAAEARQLVSAGRYAEASPVLEELVRTTPTATPAWEMLAKSYVGAGDPSAAAAAVRRWSLAGTPGAPTDESAARLTAAVAGEGESGYWEWRLQELSAAVTAGRTVPRTELAAAHAALGQDEEALALLVEAVAERERGVFTLQTDPVWDELRADPRFREVERQAQRIRFAPARSYMSRQGRPDPR
ncbi:MAG: hypothetical protein ABL963_01875 [Longimicrobiales bacterium]